MRVTYLDQNNGLSSSIVIGKINNNEYTVSQGQVTDMVNRSTTFYDPTVNFELYVVEGGADPNPAYGSHTECGYTWQGFVYSGSAPGNLMLEWYGQDPAVFIAFFGICWIGPFDGGSWSIQGFGYSQSGDVAHATGSAGFSVPWSYTSVDSYSVAVSWDYTAVFPD